MSILKYVITALLILFSSITIAQPDDDEYIWLARDEQVIKLTASSGIEKLAIRDSDNIRAIGVVKNRIFRYGNGFFSATSDTGENLFRTKVNLEGNEFEKTILEIENDYHRYLRKSGGGKIPSSYKRKNTFITGDGNNVWLTLGNTVYLYDLNGTFERKIVIGNAIRSVSLDRGRGWLWVATSNMARAFSKDGKEKKSINFGSMARVGSISYAQSLDEIWATRLNGVFRYSLNGKKKSSNIMFAVQQIAGDNRGGLWAVSHFNILKLDTNANPAKPAATSLRWRGRLYDIAVQDSNSTVWMATERTMRQYSQKGEILQNISYKNRSEGPIRAFALQERTIAPELVIISPKNNQTVSSTPTIRFAYESTLPIDKTSLVIQINGFEVMKNCNYTDKTVVCSIADELLEGPKTLIAKISDEDGNQSQSVHLSFTIELERAIDIAINTPADGLITTDRNLQIMGSLSKYAKFGLAHKAENYVKSEHISVGSNLGFDHQIKLVSGKNTLTLTAELNGEKSEKTITVTYDAIPKTPDSSKINAVSTKGKATVIGLKESVDPDVFVVTIHAKTGNVAPSQANSQGEFQVVIDADVGDKLTIVTQNKKKKERK